MNKPETKEVKPRVAIRQFELSDSDAVVGLWERCDLVRPWNDPFKDIHRKLADSPDLFFVMETTGTKQRPTAIIGAAMAGYDGHRGWVNYLAVDPDSQSAGLGRHIMDHIEAELRERGCPKINLQVRDTNSAVLAFYQSLGYKVDAAVSLGKRLIPDD